jgi:ribosomal protein S6
MAMLKAAITEAGGEVTDEEEAQRVELAYEVVKSIEGRNRKFKSAYFGWVRFKTDAANIPVLTEAVEDSAHILRHLLVKLTREEEQNPFRFHESMAAANIMVTNFDVTEEDVAEVEAEVAEDEVLTDAVVVPEVVDTPAKVA